MGVLRLWRVCRAAGCGWPLTVSLPLSATARAHRHPAQLALHPGLRPLRDGARRAQRQRQRNEQLRRRRISAPGERGGRSDQPPQQRMEVNMTVRELPPAAGCWGGGSAAVVQGSDEPFWNTAVPGYTLRQYMPRSGNNSLLNRAEGPSFRPLQRSLELGSHSPAIFPGLMDCWAAWKAYTLQPSLVVPSTPLCFLYSYAEQLVLYLKVAELLSSGLQMAIEQIRAGKLCLSSTVKQGESSGLDTRRKGHRFCSNTLVIGLV